MIIGEKFSILSDKYLKFLRQNYDSKVPQTDYENNDKFFFGLFTQINGYHYFVPISSFKTQQATNTLIYNNNNEAISSLRFCFMIPVPINVNNIVRRLDLSRKSDYYINIVDIEEKFCLHNIDAIEKKANHVYNKVHARIPKYYNNSCCFEKLEEGCRKYSIDNLSIQIHPKHMSKEFVFINKVSDCQGLVLIENGQFSRIENFDPFNPDLQVITIYAKDEFEQEKFIEVCIKITNPSNNVVKESKELVNNK